MMALFRYLYGLPYTAEANAKWISSLQPHAQLYVVAEKYQIPALQATIVENMRRIITSKFYTHNTGYLRWCKSFRNSDDFFGALSTILEVTTIPDTPVRKVLVDFIVQNIDFFKKQKELSSVFRDFPELAAELIVHPDLESEAEGSWMCDDDSCNISVPSCGTCKAIHEPHFLRRYRHEDLWECPRCKVVDEAKCLECSTTVSWVPERKTDLTEQEAGNGGGNAMDLDDGSDADTEA